MRSRIFSLAAAQLVSGAATVITHALVSRRIGRDNYAIFGVLWSATYLVSQLLFVALQFSMIRFVSDFRARGKRPFCAITSLLRVQGALTAVFLVVAAVASKALLDRVFSGQLVVLIAFLLAVTLYGATSVLRSVAMGLSMFTGVSVILALETLFRLAVVIFLLYVLDTGLAGAAIGVVAGAAASLLILPVAYKRVSGDLAQGEPETLAVRRALTFALPAFLVVGSQQIVLNSPAIVVQVLGGAEVQAVLGVFYAGFLLSRIPQYLLSPLVTTLLPDFTASAASEDTERFRREVSRASLFSLGLAAAMSLGFWLFGPLAMRIQSGPGFVLGRSHLALLAASVGIYVLADVLHLAMMARGRALISALSWLAGLTGYILALLILGVDSLYSLEVGILAAVAVPASLLWLGHILLGHTRVAPVAELPSEA